MKKKIGVFLVVLLSVGALGLYAGVRYLYNYAIVPGEKDFLSSAEKKLAKNGYEQWKFLAQQPKKVTMKARDGLNLQAAWLEQEQTKTPKVVVMAHGYGNQGATMQQYAQLFYQAGFDIFLPDARGHGESQGDYIGFGWHERLDYLDWLEQLLPNYPNNVEVVLFGVSMGASTVMMTAGEPLPKQVKAIIADCGYDTVEHELSYQLKDKFQLPAFPLIPLASAYTKYRAGYFFAEADARQQLAKNYLPILFIHGDRDTFVPTKMVYPLYEATKGPKELLIVKGAEHAENLKQAPSEYRQKVFGFLKRTLKED